MTVRNERGLTTTQEAYLLEFAERFDREEAAQQADVTERTVRRWLEEPAFAQAYDETFHEAVVTARREAQRMSEKAAHTVDELLDEMKPIPVTVVCSECGTKNQTTVSVRDAAVRGKMAEMVWKATGVLKDIRRHEVEGEVLHLGFEEKLALGALRMGKRISAQMYERLDNKRLIPEELKRPDDPSVIIEGEAKEVPPDG